jgi:hypothetical protein
MSCHPSEPADKVAAIYRKNPRLVRVISCDTPCQQFCTLESALFILILRVANSPRVRQTIDQHTCVLIYDRFFFNCAVDFASQLNYTHQSFRYDDLTFYMQNSTNTSIRFVVQNVSLVIYPERQETRDCVDRKMTSRAGRRPIARTIEQANEIMKYYYSKTLLTIAQQYRNLLLLMLSSLENKTCASKIMCYISIENFSMWFCTNRTLPGSFFHLCYTFRNIILSSLFSLYLVKPFGPHVEIVHCKTARRIASSFIASKTTSFKSVPAEQTRPSTTSTA